MSDNLFGINEVFWESSMNKHVYALWLMSHDHKLTVDINGHPKEVILQNPQRFADLIVQELCSLMAQCQDDVTNNADVTENNWGYADQLQGWIDCFQEHFEKK